jgi:hypothetical protein
MSVLVYEIRPAPVKHLIFYEVWLTRMNTKWWESFVGSLWCDKYIGIYDNMEQAEKAIEILKAPRRRIPC